MRPTNLSFLMVIAIITFASSSFAVVRDSVQDSASRKYNIEVTGRIHSSGFFGYGGFIATHNASADVMLRCTRGHAGLMAVKAVDLFDLHSHYNFSMAMIYYNIPIGKRLTVTPYAGLALDQRFSFGDRGSDAMSFLISTFKVNKQLTVEHTARFSNCVVEPHNFDWLNRFRLQYAHDHWIFGGMAFFNTKAFDTNAYSSFAASVSYNKIKVADHISMSTGVTGVMVATSTDEEMKHDCGGLFFTIALAVH